MTYTKADTNNFQNNGNRSSSSYNLFYLRYNVLNKGGRNAMNYKKEIMTLVYKVENEKYLKYIYVLLKTFLEI